MRKLFVLFMVCLIGISNVSAQDEAGFGTSGDFLVGYKDKTFSTTIGYDFGCRIIPNLYVGVGPMVGASFGNGDSKFAGGGYGKIRFTVPLNLDTKPFVDGRVGYSYSFSDSKGDMFYGAGLGMRFAERYCIGLYCILTYSKTMTTESYIKGYEKRYNPIDKKYHQVAMYGTREIENKKSIYTPTLLFSVDF